MRGSSAARILLKFALAMEKDAQQIGSRWLKTLKDSNRNWPPNRSVNLRFLNSPKSVRQKPGRRTAPGLSDVIVACPTAGSANAEELNHPSKPCGSLDLGSPLWLSRNAHCDGPRQSPPFAS